MITAEYLMKLRDEKNFINADMTAVCKRTITALDVTKDCQPQSSYSWSKIDDERKLPLITLLGNSLVSVSSDQTELSLTGQPLLNNTHISGDDHIDVTNPMKTWAKAICMVSISKDKLAAGVWSKFLKTHAGVWND